MLEGNLPTRVVDLEIRNNQYRIRTDDGQQWCGNGVVWWHLLNDKPIGYVVSIPIAKRLTYLVENFEKESTEILPSLPPTKKQPSRVFENWLNRWLAFMESSSSVFAASFLFLVILTGIDACKPDTTTQWYVPIVTGVVFILLYFALLFVPVGIYVGLDYVRDAVRRWRK